MASPTVHGKKRALKLYYGVLTISMQVLDVIVKCRSVERRRAKMMNDIGCAPDHVRAALPHAEAGLTEQGAAPGAWPGAAD
jgi:hypothetical protein